MERFRGFVRAAGVRREREKVSALRGEREEGEERERERERDRESQRGGEATATRVCSVSRPTRVRDATMYQCQV
jgi:hypothetical protein